MKGLLYISAWLTIFLVEGGWQTKLLADAPFSYRLRYLTMEDGLPQNNVDAILRDREGFMWFATWDGLCRYDGYRFQVFKANGRQPGLPDNFVQTICESADGQIWVGTAHGIGIYEPRSQQFLPAQELLPSLSRSNIRTIITDRQDRMWIGTEGEGIFSVGKNTENGSYGVKHIPMPGVAVYTLLSLPDEGVLAGTSNGIYDIDLDKGTASLASAWQLPDGLDRDVISLWKEPDGPLWAGTDVGLLIFDQAGEAPFIFTHDPDDPHSLIHNTVTAIQPDGLGQLLLGTLGGICQYQAGASKFVSLKGSVNAHTQLNSVFVNSLLCDRYGNVWIGTEKGGVNTYNIHQKKFERFAYEKTDPNSLTHPTVNSILAEVRHLWVGTAGGGLHRIDRSNERILAMQHDIHRATSISSDFVTSMLRDQAGRLWIGTWGTGLNLLLGEESQNFQRFPVGANGLHSGFISSLVEDPAGFLLVGTLGGISLFDPGSERFQQVILPRRRSGESVQVGCILLDAQGYYWLGTRAGLYRFHRSCLSMSSSEIAADSLAFFSKEALAPNGLRGDYVISLKQDVQGNVWVGTFGNGIGRVLMEAGQVTGFEFFTQEQGLCNNTVYAIEEDSEGHLWLSTDQGLARFNPVSRQFRTYYQVDGLTDNQFYWSASSRDAQGRLYFGGINGLTSFLPQDIRPYPFAPEVEISDFSVLNKPLQVGEKRHGRVALRRSISQSDTVFLSYLDNVFSIEFAVQTYVLPQRVTYRYQMEGVDQDWVSVPADRHFANYTNLLGGTYHFHVTALSEDGIESSNVRTLTVVIRPPFWQTTWFVAALILLGVLLVMAYIRLRTHYLHQQKKKLARQVALRTAQIEAQNAILEEQKGHLLELNEQVKMVNQMRLRFFTNISHEFRTPLTLIIDPIESLLSQFSGDTATGRTLQIVYRNAQRLLHLIQQLMSFRRLEAGKLQARVGEGDVVTFAKEVFHSFQKLADNQRIEYQFDVQGEAEGETWFDAEKLENVLYNLLANAFKFTPAEGKISLEIRFDRQIDPAVATSSEGASPKPELHLAVRDSGIGIPEAQQEHIFDYFYQVPARDHAQSHGSGIGLALTKELVSVMHGEIRVESVPGEGSLFEVRLPYLAYQYEESERIDHPRIYRSNLSTQVNLVEDQLQARLAPSLTELNEGESDKPLLLIAEDNYDLRAFLIQSLAGEYRILEADNGKEALELATKYGPQLIISDIMMPIMDGLELCSHLKESIQTSHIPLILLTSRNMVEHWVEGLEAGADDYVPKPFHLQILQARIENLISSRRRLQALFGQPQRPKIEEVAQNPLDQKFVKQLYELLDTHLGDPDYGPDQVASDLCISRSLLYKKIKALSSMSVTEFVNAHKLEKACTMLLDPEMNISEVAYRCGFNDPKYFSRVFRKRFGISPKEYARGGEAGKEAPGVGDA